MDNLLNRMRHFFVGICFAIANKIFSSRRNSFILMFHHVSNGPGDFTPVMECTKEHFENVLIYLQDNNYNVISLDEAISRFSIFKLRNFVVITFDDGIDNTFTEAYPILKKYNVPFTIYITIDYIDKEGYLTTSQLEELNKDPLCTIGSHTFTHPNLTNSESLNYEIEESRIFLESFLKDEVCHFAYPYGGLSTITRESKLVIKRAGYLSAVTTVSVKLNMLTSADRLLLPRINGSLYLLD